MVVPGQQRQAIYHRLQRRNQVVGALRILVPALGVLVLVALSAQIYLSSLGARFGIGQLTVTPDSIAVDAPQYSGLLDDGSSYKVSAALARAPTSRTELIDLQNAAVAVTQPGGAQMSAQASEAQLNTTTQEVIIPGPAQIADSGGTEGTLTNSVFDWSAQVLTTKGPVVIDYADGSKVRAAGLVYDASTRVWTFSGATVTLPNTPKAASPAGEPDATGDTDE